MRSLVVLALLSLPLSAAAQPRCPSLETGAPKTYALDPEQVEVRDLDGDGVLDVAGRLNGHAVALYGRGDGTLEDAAAIADDILSDPDHFARGDVDGDGKGDLVGYAFSYRRFGVYRGDGRGNFAVPFLIGEPGGFSGRAVLADLDRDGNLDAILLHDAPRVSVIFGPIRDSSAATTQLPSALGTKNAAAGDFDGNGTIDLAVVSEASRVTIFSHDGHGTFTRTSELAAHASPRAAAMAAADFDNDGAIDLLVPASESAIAIVLGNGDGTFRASRMLDYDASQFGFVLGAHDIDGDGVDELLTHHGAKGVFVDFEKLPLTRPLAIHMPVAFADVHDSPGVEVVAGDDFRVVVLARRSGAWIGVESHAAPSEVQAVGAIDGRVAYVAGNVLYVESRALGTFDWSAWFFIHTADVDGDARLDLVLVRSGRSDFVLGPIPVTVTAGEIALFRGRGDGTFAPPERLLSNTGIDDAAVADFNADGAMDVAVATETRGLLLLAGDGTGRFSITPIAPLNLAQVEARDLDGDTIADLIVHSERGLSLFSGSRAGLQHRGNWLAGGTRGHFQPWLGMFVARLRRGAPPAIGKVIDAFAVAVEFDCRTRRRGVRH